MHSDVSPGLSIASGICYSWFARLWPLYARFDLYKWCAYSTGKFELDKKLTLASFAHMMDLFKLGMELTPWSFIHTNFNERKDVTENIIWCFAASKITRVTNPWFISCMLSTSIFEFNELSELVSSCETDSARKPLYHTEIVTYVLQVTHTV